MFAPPFRQVVPAIKVRNEPPPHPVLPHPPTLLVLVPILARNVLSRIYAIT